MAPNKGKIVKVDRDSDEDFFALDIEDNIVEVLAQAYEESKVLKPVKIYVSPPFSNVADACNHYVVIFSKLGKIILHEGRAPQGYPEASVEKTQGG